jgi:DNA-directed RNA polymerase sigma subunit (sigma70/sigma32)
MRNARAAYDRSNAQLYSAFKYPTLRNEDAVMLVGLVDDCVYRALRTLDCHTDWVRHQYARFATSAIFKQLRKSHSSVGDHLLYTMLPQLNGPNWLDLVRKDINLHRGHWIKAIQGFLKRYECYQDLCISDDPAARKKAEAIELELDASSHSLYGAIAEARHQLNRVSGIIERMVRPYLRKIVSLARAFANEPWAFFENYQNGYHGILLAIGRYDTRIGAYAFIADMWIKSYMVNGISVASNTIKMPSRVWKHRSILERNSHLEIEQIAKREGIDAKLLHDSAHLLDIRNAMPIIEESDENAESLEDYHDRRVERENEVAQTRQQIEAYSKGLSARDRLVLSIAFDIDLHLNDIDQQMLDREAARQLYACQCESH